MKKKLLLHTCCAPCAVYVVNQLQATYDVTLFFFNPNIQPVQEYRFREHELEKISLQLNWNTLFPPPESYQTDSEDWFHLVRGFEQEPERGHRCSICFHMRLARSFSLAKQKGFDIVASTLSISPYKVTPQINREGLELSRTSSIEFLPENFKKQNGYETGRKMARELGIVHQDYCGCIYSKEERENKLKQKKEVNHEKNS